MKELINRETAIHRIYNEVSRVSNDGSSDHRTIELWAQLVMDGLFRAVKIVREMEAEELKELHWILCSERLPECEKPVLVTGIYGAVFIAIRKYDPIYEDYIWWHSEHGRVRVKAWMPLQDPYEGGREEWD